MALALSRLAVIALLAGCPALAAAQQQTRTPQPAGPCATKAASSDAATPPGAGGKEGTRPGDSGSTGWTGGLGGSYIGTTQAGPNPSSPSQHPETATGLDPMTSVSRRQAAAC
jgi:hypothetical protein